MRGGFKESPLKLNAGLGQSEVWNEAAILERAGRLADQALRLWVAPKLTAETLATYRPTKVREPGSYTIDDHPFLANGSEMYGPGVRDLFDAFRKEVLALDPCVTEEFMKLYVAYKAESIFADVIPQAKRLLLVINMPFAEITDPKRLCRDITKLGRWGNGDVEVPIKSIEELPYIMSLVRQSYERQMSDEGRV